MTTDTPNTSDTPDPRCWCDLEGEQAKLVTINEDGVSVDETGAVFMVPAELRRQCPVHGHLQDGDEDEDRR